MCMGLWYLAIHSNKSDPNVAVNPINQFKSRERERRKGGIHVDDVDFLKLIFYEIMQKEKSDNLL